MSWKFSGHIILTKKKLFPPPKPNFLFFWKIFLSYFGNLFYFIFELFFAKGFLVRKTIFFEKYFSQKNKIPKHKGKSSKQISKKFEFGGGKPNFFGKNEVSAKVSVWETDIFIPPTKWASSHGLTPVTLRKHTRILKKYTWFSSENPQENRRFGISLLTPKLLTSQME